MKLFAALLPVVCAVGLAAQSFTPQDKKDPGYVSAEVFGATWPLTVPEAIVRCQPPELLTLRVPGRGLFSLNGAAKVALKLETPEAVWKFDPKIPGNIARISIRPLLDAARKLCK